ncbi:tol-pal system-associated acyl-CoA thioesterase [Derxia gummosa]|uniref:Tol-pal system-associated acyl-CoA thioesterase n=1 Tax=Derxia gummosa DSM 723 TaxID=1121388 RepID=A0A8B6X5J0_9BURK|nr:tol-pal system-associated acyl-CoA thioesterase [Derxia gummosa]
MNCYRHAVRVYYEDTDAGGIVYYANYLRFLERARTEILRAHDIHQAQWIADKQLAFVVRRVEADYIAPAKLDDVLEIITRAADIAGATLDLHQEIRRDGELLLEARVRLACLDLARNRATRLPAELKAIFATAR